MNPLPVSSIESLESRIAPAALSPLALLKGSSTSHFAFASVNLMTKTAPTHSATSFVHAMATLAKTLHPTVKTNSATYSIQFTGSTSYLGSSSTGNFTSGASLGGSTAIYTAPTASPTTPTTTPPGIVSGGSIVINPGNYLSGGSLVLSGSGAASGGGSTTHPLVPPTGTGTLTTTGGSVLVLGGSGIASGTFTGLEKTGTGTTPLDPGTPLGGTLVLYSGSSSTISGASLQISGLGLATGSVATIDASTVTNPGRVLLSSGTTNIANLTSQASTGPISGAVLTTSNPFAGVAINTLPTNSAIVSLTHTNAGNLVLTGSSTFVPPTNLGSIAAIVSTGSGTATTTTPTP